MRELEICQRCKCYGVMQVNSLWYCKQHGEKELGAVAIQKPAPVGGKGAGEK